MRELRRCLTLLIRVAFGALALIAVQAVAAQAHPIIPTSTLIPINSYYGTMLQQSGESPFRVQHLDLSAHRLVRSGRCVYNGSGVRLGLVESTVDTPTGEKDTYCATTPGGRKPPTEITPRGQLISNPSMNFQPILEQIGEQAANSVGLSPISHGAPLRVTINVDPKLHSAEADVFYARGGLTGAGAKQLKELRFLTHGHTETVRKVWR